MLYLTLFKAPLKQKVLEVNELALVTPFFIYC